MEAERYVTPDPFCDPDGDGEHTSVQPQANASGGQAVFLPRSSCGLNFGSVVFPTSGRFESFQLTGTSGAVVNANIEVRVIVDGVEAARGAKLYPFGWKGVVGSFSTANPVNAGAHTVRLEVRNLATPSYLNMWIDHIEGSFGTAPGATVIDATGRVEGESFTEADAGCRPDADGEMTEPLDDLLASGGAKAFMPHTSCGLNYGLVTFPTSGVFDRFRIATGGATSGTMEVAVRVDGEIVARGSVSIPAGPMVMGAFTAPVTVPAGTHRLRVEYEMTSGFWYMNGIVDYVEGTFGGGCRSLPPAVPAAPTGDGMTGGYGWVSRPYQFGPAPSADADGDVAQLEFFWGDGTSSTSNAHLWTEAGDKTLSVIAWDGAGARCPAAKRTGSTSGTSAFRVIDENWTPAFTRPGPSSSCAADIAYSDFRIEHHIVGSCTMRAVAGNGSLPASLVARVDFRLDGQVRFQDPAAPYEWVYRTSFAPMGTRHSLDVCSRAAGDKYGVVFCSEPYEFLNL